VTILERNIYFEDQGLTKAFSVYILYKGAF